MVATIGGVSVTDRSVPATGLEARDLRFRTRVRLGQCLYLLGLSKYLLPAFVPKPGPLRRRMLAYLEHYLASVRSADSVLLLKPLDAQFAVDLIDHMLQPFLRERGEIYEIAEIRHICANVMADDHILDIGANHGFWGVAVARAAGLSAKLHLFEANPVLVLRLRKTLLLNRQIDARLHGIAVGDGTSESISFFRPQGNLSGLGSTVLHDYANGQGYLRADDQIRVATRSIDQLMDAGEITGMDVVKIDVEHAEDAVIDGAKRAIDRFKPRLLMVETGVDSRATSTLLAAGYSMTALGVDGREFTAPLGYWGNLLFRRPAPRVD